MSRLTHRARLAVACAFAVTSLAVVVASPAGAATGSLAAASNGFTATFTGGTTADHADLTLWPVGHTCATTDSPGQATYFMTTDTGAPAGMSIPTSPASFTFDSPMFTLQGGPQVVNLAAGSYVVCLVSVVMPGPVTTALGNLSVTIVDPSATTTTAAPTTTTTAAEEPATPTFTG